MPQEILYPRNTTSWSLPGTETFRKSSRKLFKKWGSNLQNPTKTICGIYLPDFGDAFAQGDQSGAEALVMAYLCRPGNYRDLFLNGIKSHVFVALHAFTKEWQKRLPELDLRTFTSAKIKDLKSVPGWKKLEALIKESDNWPAKIRFYFIAKQVCHCVDDKTKVLTRTGWKYFYDLIENEEIMVFHADGKTSFEVPSKINSFDYDDQMISLHENQLDQVITPDHTVVYNTNEKIKTIKAKHFIHYSSLRIPTSAYYEGGNDNITENQTKLVVAIQADGCITTDNNVRFRLKRQRKIDRLTEILNTEKLVYRKELKQDGITEFYVYNCNCALKYFNKDNKEFGGWLLNWNRKALDVFCDELKYWDGTFEESYCHKREAYFSMKIKNAVWVDTILHLTNKQGTYNKAFDGTHQIGINNRRLSTVKGHDKIHYKGKVYCPTVSTGMFLIKRNGKISVTGNSSNYDITPAALIMNILKKSEGSISLTLAEGTSFLALYHSLFPEIREYHREIQSILKATRTLNNLFGYPRQFGAVWNNELLKEAYAFIPQSTVGIITSKAFVRMQTYIEDNHLAWDVMNDKHDSVLIQAPYDEIFDAAKILKSSIEQDLISPRGEKFKMRCEVQVGLNWQHASKSNPWGLSEIRL